MLLFTVNTSEKMEAWNLLRDIFTVKNNNNNNVSRDFCSSTVSSIDMLTFTGLTAEEYYLLIHLLDIVWVNANLSRCAAQRSKHQQFSEQVRLSLTLILSPLSVSPSLSHSLLPPHRAGQDFSVLHPHSISCLVLLSLAPHPSPPASCAAPPPPPPASVFSLAKYRHSLHWVSVLTHSSVTHHFIGLYLAFIISQHLYHCPTETHQEIVTPINHFYFITMSCCFVTSYKYVATKEAHHVTEPLELDSFKIEPNHLMAHAHNRQLNR